MLNAFVQRTKGRAISRHRDDDTPVRFSLVLIGLHFNKFLKGMNWSEQTMARRCLSGWSDSVLHRTQVRWKITVFMCNRLSWKKMVTSCYLQQKNPVSQWLVSITSTGCCTCTYSLLISGRDAHQLHVCHENMIHCAKPLFKEPRDLITATAAGG